MTAAIAAATELARWRPRVSEARPAVDPDRVEAAAAEFLEALGLPLDSESMLETPGRMARAYTELLTVPDFDLTTFPNDEEYDELVLVENIPVHSLCEHHMLPFVGVAHIGYLPGQRIVGLSKFARLVEFHARRAQTQERLTQQIAEHFRRRLEPRGVGVVIEAAHSCMSIRGARVPAARTVTSALLGRLRDDPASRAEFLSLARPSRDVR
jgi:GTP cyclohydrolase I